MIKLISFSDCYHSLEHSWLWSNILDCDQTWEHSWLRSNMGAFLPAIKLRSIPGCYQCQELFWLIKFGSFPDRGQSWKHSSLWSKLDAFQTVIKLRSIFYCNQTCKYCWLCCCRSRNPPSKITGQLQGETERREKVGNHVQCKSGLAVCQIGDMSWQKLYQ